MIEGRITNKYILRQFCGSQTYHINNDKLFDCENKQKIIQTTMTHPNKHIRRRANEMKTLFNTVPSQILNILL